MVLIGLLQQNLHQAQQLSLLIGRFRHGSFPPPVFFIVSNPVVSRNPSQKILRQRQRIFSVFIRSLFSCGDETPPPRCRQLTRSGYRHPPKSQPTLIWNRSSSGLLQDPAGRKGSPAGFPAHAPRRRKAPRAGRLSTGGTDEVLGCTAGKDGAGLDKPSLWCPSGSA